MADPRKTIDELLTDARATLARLEPAEAFAAFREGATLIDTRSADVQEHDGTIPGALSLPLSILEWRVDPASPYRDPRVGGTDSFLVLICAHGYSSSLAAARLHELGFARATDVIGGFEAWQRAGLPVTRP